MSRAADPGLRSRGAGASPPPWPPAPGTQEIFGRLIGAWIARGAACPLA